jgi:hypothetical protein
MDLAAYTASPAFAASARALEAAPTPAALAAALPHLHALLCACEWRGPPLPPSAPLLALLEAPAAPAPGAAAAPHSAELLQPAVAAHVAPGPLQALVLAAAAAELDRLLALPKKDAPAVRGALTYAHLLTVAMARVL